MTTEHVFALWVDREFKRQILEYIDTHRYSRPQDRNALYSAVWGALGKTEPGKTTSWYLQFARCVVHRECLRLRFDA